MEPRFACLLLVAAALACQV